MDGWYASHKLGSLLRTFSTRGVDGKALRLPDVVVPEQVNGWEFGVLGHMRHQCAGAQ